MRIDKTHYEVLGVSRNATPEQIKRAYRRLVRHYHPDVAEDKEEAKRLFILINEAYECLINPDRRVIYDAMLDREILRQQTARPSWQAEPKQPRPERVQRTARVVDVGALLNEAEKAFARAQFRIVIDTCREVLNLDRRNVRAHMLLAEVYRLQGRVDEAIAEYTLVLQLDPLNSEAENQLRRLARRRAPTSEGHLMEEKRAVFKIGINLIGLSTAGLLLMLLVGAHESPVRWLEMNLPMISTWSSSMITVLVVDSLIIGILLSVNELVGRIDDELVFTVIQASGTRPVVYPIGLLLVVINMISFYAAAVIYLIAGAVQESLSKSVLKVFLATFILVVLMAIIYTPGWKQVLLYGGNLAFPIVLVGWVIGDTFRPGW